MKLWSFMYWHFHSWKREATWRKDLNSSSVSATWPFLGSYDSEQKRKWEGSELCLCDCSWPRKRNRVNALRWSRLIVDGTNGFVVTIGWNNSHWAGFRHGMVSTWEGWTAASSRTELGDLTAETSSSQEESECLFFCCWMAVWCVMLSQSLYFFFPARLNCRQRFCIIWQIMMSTLNFLDQWASVWTCCLLPPVLSLSVEVRSSQINPAIRLNNTSLCGLQLQFIHFPNTYVMLKRYCTWKLLKSSMS